MKVCREIMLSGLQRSSLAELILKFHRLSAAYVAVGGISKCTATSRKGRVTAGGNIYR